MYRNKNVPTNLNESRKKLTAPSSMNRCIVCSLFTRLRHLTATKHYWRLDFSYLRFVNFALAKVLLSSFCGGGGGSVGKKIRKRKWITLSHMISRMSWNFLESLFISLISLYTTNNYQTSSYKVNNGWRRRSAYLFFL